MQDRETIIFRQNNTTQQKVNVSQHRSNLHLPIAQASDEDFDKKVEISMDLRMRIQKARLANKMSQKELATAVNVKASEVTQYESGALKPNNQVLGKIERVLKVKLRGKF
tara:strand:- start:1257 stop:1586 length:330 start_codon:yes stop_codon:yes gene_type:complete